MCNTKMCMQIMRRIGIIQEVVVRSKNTSISFQPTPYDTMLPTINTCIAVHYELGQEIL